MYKISVMVGLILKINGLRIKDYFFTKVLGFNLGLSCIYSKKINLIRIKD